MYPNWYGTSYSYFIIYFIPLIAQVVSRQTFISISSFETLTFNTYIIQHCIFSIFKQTSSIE